MNNEEHTVTNATNQNQKNDAHNNNTEKAHDTMPNIRIHIKQKGNNTHTKKTQIMIIRRNTHTGEEEEDPTQNKHEEDTANHTKRN